MTILRTDAIDQQRTAGVPKIDSSVSAIVPTIGRPESLRRLLDSLVAQTVLPAEVIISDGSDSTETTRVAADPVWRQYGLTVRHVAVSPPNAVRQRKSAIQQSQGKWLLLLDDDVVLEPDCLEELLSIARSKPNVAAVMATFSNQVWPQPTTVWRWYLSLVHKMRGNQWQGRVVGPLLRFGFTPEHNEISEVQWIGAGNSLISRSAYDRAGGFSEFFLYRCTMNEDVDLALKLAQNGTLLFSPRAKLTHYHAPGGRVSTAQVSEDDLFNRYLIMRRTLRQSAFKAMASILVYFVLETASNFAGSLRRRRIGPIFQLFTGRWRAIRRIALKGCRGT